MNMSILEVKDLKVSFNSVMGRVQAVKGVNLSINAGEVVGIVGESGSGKSTLLQIAGLLDVCTEGSVIINGDDVSNAINKTINYLKKLIVIACRNVAINKYNENKRKSQSQFSTTIHGENIEIADIPDVEENVEKIVLSESNYHYIKQLIDKLDPIYRDVIVLKSMQFSNEEIAYMMSISVELVRKRYSRARAKILEMGGDTLYGC